MSASSANEQVVVRFIADNASYLKGIADCQNSLNKYAVYTSNILERIEQNISKMNSTAITGAQKVAIAVEKTAQVQINAAARQMEAEAKLITSKAKLITAEQKRFSQSNSNHQVESRNAMSMFQHYTNLGAQLGFLVRQYLGLFAVFSAIKRTMSEGMGFNKFVEETTMAFSVMMKSADEAKMRMQELYDFAVKSPMTFKETAEAARQLMAYGFQANQLVGTMQMLGTVGKAVGASMQDMAYTYGTLKAQNHAYSRDLMQFSMRGIPIYEELAKVLDVNISKIQKMTEEGKVGFKEVEQAFVNMTNSGGRFGGMLEAYMKTFAGKLSMLSDIAQMQAGKLTEALFNQLKAVVDDLIVIMGTPEFSKSVKEVGVSIGVFVEGLINFVKIAAALYKPLTFLLQIFISLKIVNAIAGFFMNFPALLMKAATAVSAYTLVQSGATVATVSFSAALSALSAAMLTNPFVLMAAALSTIIMLVPTAIKKMKEYETQTKEQVKNDPMFKQQYVGGEVAALLAPSNVTRQIEDIGFRSIVDYVKVIDGIAKKYDLIDTDVASIMVNQKVITKELGLQIKNYLDKRGMALGKQPMPKFELQDLPEFPIMTLLRDMTNVDIDPYVTKIMDKTGKAITDYKVNTSGIVQKYIGNLSEDLKNNKKVTEALGGIFTDEDTKKALEAELKSLTELYVKMGELGDYAGMKDIITRGKAINEWLKQFAKNTDDLKEFNKALDKYNEEITKMQDQADANKMLGFKPTDLEQLTYTYNKTIKDVENNKGIFQYITDPAQRAEYKKLLDEIYSFNKDKIDFLASEETKKAMASYQLEYDKLLLGEDQLAVFDAELKFKLDALIASKEEYDIVAKTGELQRKNLEKEIQLTKAKNFLSGESEQSKAFWDKITINLASALGMKTYQKGTNYVPETGPALLHKGEAVIPADINNPSIAMSPNQSALFSYMQQSGFLDPIPKKQSMYEDIAEILNRTGITDKEKFKDSRISIIANTPWDSSILNSVDSNLIYADKIANIFLDPLRNNVVPGAAGNAIGRNIYLDPNSRNDPKELINHEYGHALQSYYWGEDVVAKFEQATNYDSLFRKVGASVNKVSGDVNLLNNTPFNSVAYLKYYEAYEEDFDNYMKEFTIYHQHPMEELADYLGELFGISDYSIFEDILLSKYASGTKGAARGPAIVGEKGPELVYMNGGETVIPNHMLKGYAKGTVKGSNDFSSSDGGWLAASSEMIALVDALDNNAKASWENAKALANMTVTEKIGAGLTAMGQQNSEVGQMVANNFTGAGDPVTMALLSLAKFAGSIENVQKLLNPFATILEGMQPIVEPLINGALQPLVEGFIEIGTIAGTMLAPFLNIFAVNMKLLGGLFKILLIPMQLVSEAFKWLNDKVIVPVGNVFIDIMNGIIGLVNKLPFVNIAYLDHLQTMQEIATQEEKLKTGNQSLTDTIAYLNNKLKEEVDKQIGSYKDLYELGLMTATEYEKNIKLANAQLPTQNELVSINDQQLTELTDISARIKELVALQTKIDNGKMTDQATVDALKNAELIVSEDIKSAVSAPPVVSPVVVPSVVTPLVNTPTISEGSRRNRSRNRMEELAVGTGYVPQDMMAMIHKGEIISPKPMSDSIRNGELTLGNNKQAFSGDTYIFNIEGSILTENELIDLVAKGTKKRMVRGYV